jgi:hypothetical protein
MKGKGSGISAASALYPLNFTISLSLPSSILYLPSSLSSFPLLYKGWQNVQNTEWYLLSSSLLSLSLSLSLLPSKTSKGTIAGAFFLQHALQDKLGRRGESEREQRLHRDHCCGHSCLHIFPCRSVFIIYYYFWVIIIKMGELKREK